MCELCDIRDTTGVSEETLMRIVKVVEAGEKAHLDHTILSILYSLDIPTVTITAEQAQRAAEDLEYRGLTVKENISADWSAMTYTIERGQVEEQVTGNALPPLKEGEVSPQNDLAALFKQLGLEF